MITINISDIIEKVMNFKRNKEMFFIQKDIRIYEITRNQVTNSQYKILQDNSMETR